MQTMTADMVDHPPHYRTAAGIEAVDVIEAYGLARSWHLASAMKYLLRAGRKGDWIEDLRKAGWYVRRWRTQIDGGMAWMPAMPDPRPRLPAPADVVNAFGIHGAQRSAVYALLGLAMVDGGHEAQAALAVVVQAQIDAAIEDAAA